MPSPSSVPVDTLEITSPVTLSVEELNGLKEKAPRVLKLLLNVKRKTSDAQTALPAEPTTTLVCPADISQKEAQEYAKLGLSYETRADGVLLAVYEDSNVPGKRHKFVHNPQAFVNANPPANVTWEKDGMTEQQVNLDGMKSVWHFNRNGANTYTAQLAKKQVKLADNTLIQSIASKFGAQMHKAFGIPLTAWSRPGGDLVHGGVGHSADLWLDERDLRVDRDGAGVIGGSERYGHGVFLQDTSSDT